MGMKWPTKLKMSLICPQDIRSNCETFTNAYFVNSSRIAVSFGKSWYSDCNLHGYMFNTPWRILNTEVFGIPCILCTCLALLIPLLNCSLKVPISEATTYLRASHKCGASLWDGSHQLPVSSKRWTRKNSSAGVIRPFHFFIPSCVQNHRKVSINNS